MVRFIIHVEVLIMLGLANLHSNMVRFIIEKKSIDLSPISIFTFQYG
mgnify:CR=1 FL=1